VARTATTTSLAAGLLWPSLVQRFGRLNRRGQYNDAQAVVFDVPLDDAKAQNAKSKAEREKALEDAQVRAARPYDWADIEKARERLKLLGNHVPTLDQLPNEPLPLEGPVLRRFHVEDALDTDPDLSGGYTATQTYPILFVPAIGICMSTCCGAKLPKIPTTNRLLIPTRFAPSNLRDEPCPTGERGISNGI
jgi:predicted DNA-binding WGR domain protein